MSEHGTGFENDLDGNGKVKSESSSESQIVNAQTPNEMSLPEIHSAMRKELEEIKKIKENLLSQQQVAQQSIGVKEIAEIAREVAKGMRQDNPLDLKEEPDDPEDFDKDGVIFYAFQYYLPIADDVRKGVTVFPPKRGTNSSRIIEFMPDSAKRVRNGRQEDVINICKFVSKSKKLTEWMRADMRCGKIYFESISGNAVQGNATYARRMMQILQWAKTQSAGALVTKCQELGVVPVTDIDEMRNNVAMKMSEKEFTRDANGAYIPINLSTPQHSNIFNEEAAEDLLRVKVVRKEMHETPGAAFIGEKMDRVK